VVKRTLQWHLTPLQEDLETVANRSDVVPQDVGYCVSFFFSACMHLQGAMAGGLDMTRRDLSAFHEPPSRSTHDLGEETFNYLSMLMGIQMDLSGILSGFRAVSIYDSKPNRAICDAAGCTETGEKLYASCGLASYCSKECQTLDWKSRHKRCCTRNKANRLSKPKRKEVPKATLKAREQISPALARPS